MSFESQPGGDYYVRDFPLDELQGFLDEAVQLVEGQRGLIMTPLAGSEDMRAHVGVNMDPATAWTTGEISQTILLKVATEGRGVLSHNAAEDRRFQNTTSVVVSGLRSVLCVPIKIDEKVWGVLYIDNLIKTGAFRESHLKQLKEFAARLGKPPGG